MTLTVVFDKLAFVRRLESEGQFPRSQAEALSEALHHAVSETVATKADLAEIRHEIAEMRADLTHQIAGNRTELGQEIAGIRTELGHQIAGIRTELGHEIVGIRTELGHEIAGIRTEVGREIAGIRTEVGHEIRELRAELKLWTGSLAAGLFAALSGMAAAMRFLGH